MGTVRLSISLSYLVRPCCWPGVAARAGEGSMAHARGIHAPFRLCAHRCVLLGRELLSPFHGGVASLGTYRFSDRAGSHCGSISRSLDEVSLAFFGIVLGHSPPPAHAASSIHGEANGPRSVVTVGLDSRQPAAVRVSSVLPPHCAPITPQWRGPPTCGDPCFAGKAASGRHRSECAFIRTPRFSFPWSLYFARRK